ncbi:unnamed protein product [Pseudo-nitzschia multistriata]|uniref:Pseudouridine synthase RsuA/RluA-like domain-containing protein n=1 Tax=Pseudo-nitzschia multistriata TaxID=183589 RepID=A0A448ZMP7_9STRA|nr:unnamed protein product [Pseudo-nitzschia multistriata]
MQGRLPLFEAIARTRVVRRSSSSSSKKRVSGTESHSGGRLQAFQTGRRQRPARFLQQRCYRTDLSIGIRTRGIASATLSNRNRVPPSAMRSGDSASNQNQHGEEDPTETDGASGKTSAQEAVLDDRPCWALAPGARHGLGDLLSLVDKEKSIAYDSPGYLVLNKPPDLRMDGPYPSSVFKLLTYWYPPPSLEGLAERASGPAGSGGDPLLDALAGLHRHSDVRDNALRPCHQLDYATSGVLLVAKTQEAAAHVGRLLEDRHEGVRKSYVAVVVGDMALAPATGDADAGAGADAQLTGSPAGGATGVPVWEGGGGLAELRTKMRQLEGAYRKERAAVGKEHRRSKGGTSGGGGNAKKRGNQSSTFPGFQPAHSIFLKWKSRLATRGGAETAAGDTKSPRKKRRKKGGHPQGGRTPFLAETDWEAVWEPLEEAVGGIIEEDRERLLSAVRAASWKDLRKDHPSLAEAVARATDVHNERFRSALLRAGEQQREENGGGGGEDLPTVFRLRAGDDNGNDDNHNHKNNDGGGGNDTFYVCCPLAQHPDRFHMVVPEAVAGEHPGRLPQSPSNGATGGLRFRPSLTRCTVLERGRVASSSGSVAITKVRLFPVTGRRHQLRVHMALAGFPILGDATYARPGAARGGGERRAGSGRGSLSSPFPRMCLHAESLELPSLLGEESGWRAEAPDPFVFGPDGCLRWSLA